MSREVTATIDGNTYTIPEIWLAGFCQSNDCHVEEAIRHWHWQSQLAERESDR